MKANSEFKKVEGMLYNYKNLFAEIRILKSDLEILENDYKGIGAINYYESTSKTNKFNSKVENEVVEREEKIERLKGKIRFKELQIRKIDIALEALNEDERYLIEEYYMNRKQLKFISGEMGLAESYASTYKASLVNKIVNIIFSKEYS